MYQQPRMACVRYSQPPTCAQNISKHDRLTLQVEHKLFPLCSFEFVLRIVIVCIGLYVNWYVLICFWCPTVAALHSTSKGLHVSLSTQTRRIACLALVISTPSLSLKSKRNPALTSACVFLSSLINSPVIHVIRANTTSISFFEINGSHVDTLWTTVDHHFERLSKLMIELGQRWPMARLMCRRITLKVSRKLLGPWNQSVERRAKAIFHQLNQ